MEKIIYLIIESEQSKEENNLGLMEEMKGMLKQYLESGIPADKGLGPDYNKVIQFEITGDKTFYMEIKGGKNLSIHEGTHAKPDITIGSDAATMTGINAGKVNPTQAFMQGKIKVKGAMMELMKLQKIIFPSVKT
jgi:putative sterol carrier protein